MIRQITSAQNPAIRNLLLLQEKPRERRNQNLTVVEGHREIRLAQVAGHKLHSLFVCQELIGKSGIGDIVGQAGADCEVNEITRDLFSRVAYRDDSGGIVALVQPMRTTLEDLKPGTLPLILVLETVEKPGNLGAILRTADAAALDAVIICDPQTDIFNPNAIRSSLGCIFTLPVVTASTPETINWLRENKIRSFATTLSATGNYHDCDFRQPAAIIMGSEAFGLSELWLGEADAVIRIPMMGKVDSMNVSASAAIVVFEALRQRGFKNAGR